MKVKGWSLIGLAVLSIIASLYQAVAFTMYYEGKFRPVVKNFIVEVMDREEGYIYMSGSMDKVRPCKFKGVVAYVSYEGKAKQLTSVEFLDAVVEVVTEEGIEEYVTRTQGYQAYGQWKIKVDGHSRLELASRHTCDGKQIFTDLVTVDLRG